MDNYNDTTIHRKGKHFSKENRYFLQGILRAKAVRPSLRNLAEIMDCSPNTIRNELKRGEHPNTGRYSAARAQRDYDKKHKNSTKKSCRFVVTPFTEYVCEKVNNEHWSLDVCVGYAKTNQLFSKEQMVCTKTLYNYIDAMLLKIRNIDLPLKVKRSKKSNRKRTYLKQLGRSIDERPEEIQSREEFGHWEIDTVIGSKSKSDNAILTLCERKTRVYISMKIDGKNSAAVNKGLSELQGIYGSKFDEVFKSITSDNGSEFSELSNIESTYLTKVYFAHPYTASERPSNERTNGLLRRFIPKGRRIDNYSDDEVLFVSDWCNDLPRKILNYKTPNELFEQELDRIYAV